MKNLLASHTYLEVSISGKEPSLQPYAFEVFFRAGMGEEQLAVCQFSSRFELRFYTRSLRQVSRIYQAFAVHKVPGLKLRSRLLRPADWRDKWKRDYHIRPVGRRFMIVPVWEKRKYCAGRRIPVYLDPHGAFGSGMHETTRLVIRLLEEVKGGNWSLLDLGTGSGVLAVCGGRLGASEVLGIDIDRSSVKAARENFIQHNGLQGGRFRHADLRHLRLRKKFDVVAANLFSELLLECQHKLTRWLRPGGILILSGILRRYQNTFFEHFQPQGLRLRKVIKGRRWLAALFSYSWSRFH